MDVKDLLLTYRDQKRFAEAEPLAKRLAAIMETTASPRGVRSAFWLSLIADVALNVGHSAEAESLLNRALAIPEVNSEDGTGA